MTSGLCKENHFDANDVEFWRLLALSSLSTDSFVGMIRAHEGLHGVARHQALDPSNAAILRALDAQMRAQGIGLNAASRPSSTSDWADVVSQAPDPIVVDSVDFRARIEATRLPWKVRCRETGIELVLIPHGEYMRGASDLDPDGEANERPAHHVVISKPFYLGVTEVTNQQYRGFNPAHVTVSWGQLAANENDLPVSWLSADAVEGFCRAYSLRLPTHAEWEWACRAGTTTSRYGPLSDIAWTWEDSRWGIPPSHPSLKGLRIHPSMKGKRVSRSAPFPVGTKRANAFGLFDMIGNLEELVADQKFDNNYDRFSKSLIVRDPLDAEYRAKRILCGGHWRAQYFECRASSYVLTSGGGGFGFRIAHDAP